MASQNYDPCDPKQALKQQGKVLLQFAAVVSSFILAWAAIVGFILLLIEIMPIIGPALGFLFYATLYSVFGLLVLAMLALVFHPVIELAVCRLTGKHKSS